VSATRTGDDAVVLHRVVVGPLDTNCWLLHAEDDPRALVVDPGDDAARILEAVRRLGLDVRAIVLTHTHFDHVLAVPEVTAALGRPVLAHPAETRVWANEVAYLHEHGHWDAGTATADLLRTDPAALRPDSARPLWDGTAEPVDDGDHLQIGPLSVTLLHTPGHSPGSLTIEAGGHLLTGDTLFPGGPGLTGSSWPLSDFPAIMHSVDRLVTRPDDTAVHPGHGLDTTIGAERPHIGEWRSRGW
jgi:hydroxyacylglutathione hydrolase